MNKKGQVLVAFLLILPLLLLIMAAVIDTGYNYIYRIKIENEIKQAIKYKFNTDDDENIIISKITSNLKKYDANPLIKISQNYIIITLEYKRENIFASVIKKEETKIYFSYSGTIENDKVIIRKE